MLWSLQLPVSMKGATRGALVVDSDWMWKAQIVVYQVFILLSLLAGIFYFEFYEVSLHARNSYGKKQGRDSISPLDFECVSMC